MRQLRQQMLDAHGEAIVTIFMIERHRREAAGVLKDTVRRDSVIATYRWTETLPGRPLSDDGSECGPADFYAGRRYGPLVSKSWFSFRVESNKDTTTRRKRDLVFDVKVSTFQQIRHYLTTELIRAGS